jgi:hypothetical protein
MPGQHVAKMLLAEDEHVIEALAAKCPNEPLRERVRPRQPDRRLDHPRAVPGEDAVEYAVMPRTCTVLVWISMAKKTYTRWSSTVSTCRKSQARMPDAWLARNCRHVGDARRGAGPRPAAARIRRIVPSPTRYPRPSSSPWQVEQAPHQAVHERQQHPEMVPATLPIPQQNPSSRHETKFPSGTRGGWGPSTDDSFTSVTLACPACRQSEESQVASDAQGLLKARHHIAARHTAALPAVPRAAGRLQRRRKLVGQCLLAGIQQRPDGGHRPARVRSGQVHGGERQ